MSLIIKDFAGTGGANLGPRLLVERTTATRLAFIDHDYGCRGSEVSLIDRGFAEGEEADVYATLAGGIYPLCFEVTSSSHGQFSIHDGSTWQGPFAVPAGVPCGMLVRYSPGSMQQDIRIKFKADAAASRVLVQARSCPSPAQMAAI